MMDRRDDWPDGILEGDLDAFAGRGPAERRVAERIARDARNMNEVLSAMASEVSERVPTPIHGRTAPVRRGPFSRWRTVAPLAAAAIAALVLVRGGEMAREDEPFIPPPESRVPSMVSEMDVEADIPFAVLPTSDPDIAVVWLFYPQESD